MKNWEKYEMEIRTATLDDLALLEDGTLTDCYVVSCCDNCVFSQKEDAWDCGKARTEWLYEEVNDEH